MYFGALEPATGISDHDGRSRPVLLSPETDNVFFSPAPFRPPDRAPPDRAALAPGACAGTKRPPRADTAGRLRGLPRTSLHFSPTISAIFVHGTPGTKKIIPYRRMALGDPIWPFLCVVEVRTGFG